MRLTFEEEEVLNLRIPEKVRADVGCFPELPIAAAIQGRLLDTNFEPAFFGTDHGDIKCGREPF